MNRIALVLALLSATLLAACAAAAPFDPVQVLVNTGFESGDLVEPASDFLPVGRWTTGDAGVNETRAVLRDDYAAKVRVTDTVINTLRPEIFGDNIEWTNKGMGLYFPASDRFDADAVSALREAGITHLRYPGGTLSDYFIWHDAIGSDRKEVPNPFAEPVKGKPEYPAFGPEEFARFCKAMGVRASVTLNAGTGTPEQAAEVVRWCVEHGLDVIDYTVGNEIYMIKSSEEPVPSLPVAKSAEQYVAFYKACDDAIRAFAPDVRMGAIGGVNTGLIPLTVEPDWLRIVVTQLGDRIDFIDLHNAYAPVLRNVGFDFQQVTTDDEYAATFMAAPEYVRDNLAATKAVLRRYAPGRAIDIHITEYGPLVYPFRPGSAADKNSDMAWNRNLAGALYLASLFHLFAEEPRITSANHLPLYQGGFGALVGLEWHAAGRKFWRNAVYPVFQTYARLAGSEVLDVTVEGPTFDALAGGFVPALPSVALLDAAAFRSADGTLALTLVSRSIGGTATVTIDAPEGMRLSSAELLTADDYHAENSVQSPDTVAFKPLPTDQILLQQPLTLRLPKHSLTVVRFERR